MNVVKIYTDGGCRGNGKEKSLGAWAYVILDDTYSTIIEENAQVEGQCSTNIRAEMLAITEGLKAVAMRTEIDEISKTNVEVHTDSKFFCDCINKGWLDSWIDNNWIKKDKKPVANKDLWELFLAIETLFNHIEFIHCKGHNGEEFNERCDKLVNLAMNEYLKESGEK